MLTTKEASRRLGVNAETVRRWWKAGRLEGRQYGPLGRIQIDEASVERLLEEARRRGAQEK